MNKNKRSQSLIQLLLFIGIMVFVNVLANYFFTNIDLTEEKRFTFTKPTQDLLEDLEDVVYVQLLLDGKFPAGFKRLQRATIEMLNDFRASSGGNLEYVIENPSDGTREEVDERKVLLSKEGINPMNFRFKDGEETTEQLIYPWAVFNHRGRSISVNLLENQIPGLGPEEALNNSVSLLEYKFANAIQKLQSNKRQNIVFTTGHGELTEIQTASLEGELRKTYNTGRLDLSTVPIVNPEIDMMIVAKPKTTFTEKDKFKIDQFIMNGGKVMWLIDRLNAQLDSLQGRPFYVPMDYPLNIEDQLFRYGVKIEPNLVLDLECTRIPKVVGQVGNKPQLDLDRWFYHPMVMPSNEHPIVKSLDRVNLFFPSSIDTMVRTRTNILKTVLLESSRYSRMQYSPVRLNLEFLRYDPDPSKFNKGPQIMGVLLEGVFPSLYENRVPASMLAGLEEINISYQSRSEPNRMLVVSDGDVTKNTFVKESNEIRTLGFNKYENYLFANKQFMLNAIEYLLDGRGVIEARGKEVKLRLLDTVKAKAEKTKWRIINIVLPLVLLALFAFLFNFSRKKRYT